MDLEIVIERAKTSDGKGLTYISKKAFDDDSKRFLNREAGGPPGYAAEKVNNTLIRCNDYYKIRSADYTTLGGIIISIKAHKGLLQRIFIDPAYQNQGIGEYVINYIEKLYPEVKEWELDTPSENVRTNHFYQKCGYELIGKKKEFNYYRKSL